MKKCNVFVILLTAFLMGMLADRSFARGVLASQHNDGLAMKLVSDSLFRQDTIGKNKKKIKEIAPAKRQPKPERIDDPTENGAPGIFSQPQFPGTDNRRQPNGGNMQPGERPQPAERPQPGGNSNGGNNNGGSHLPGGGGSRRP